MYVNYFGGSYVAINDKLIFLKREIALFYLRNESIYLKGFGTECALCICTVIELKELN